MRCVRVHGSRGNLLPVNRALSVRRRCGWFHGSTAGWQRSHGLRAHRPDRLSIRQHAVRSSSSSSSAARVVVPAVNTLFAAKQQKSASDAEGAEGSTESGGGGGAVQGSRVQSPPRPAERQVATESN